MGGKTEGGFDEGFLAVSEQIFDTTMKEMGFEGRGYAITVGSHPRNPSVASDQDRVAFYSRAYGELKGFKKYIWDDPAQAAKKQEYVDAAKQSLVTKYGTSHVLSHPRRKSQ
jgi:hypothetical protein